MNEFEHGLKFTIERAGVAAEELEVDAPRALLGSGAHCEVRLGAHEAAPEQLLVVCTLEGLEAECQGAARATLLDGVPFVRGVVADGARFNIGGCRVRIERSGSMRPRSKPRARGSARIFVALLTIASIAAFATLWLDPSGADSLGDRPTTPPIWSASDAQACARSGSEARELGAMHWQAALMKRERSHYHLEDAMVAVSLFQRAAACYEQSGDRPTAAHAERQFDRLLRPLEADYHRRHVLLERAILQSDWQRVALEAGALRQLLGGRRPDYTNWLYRIERLAISWAQPVGK